MKQPHGSIHVTSLTDSYFAKRRARQNDAASGSQRLYPWLLLASTAIAGIFCFAYITKPVFLTQSQEKPALAEKTASPAKPANPVIEKTGPITQGNPPLPLTTEIIPPAPLSTGYEETNIRMQHILDVSSTNGDVHRLVVDVPALYKSRSLRWTQGDAAQARLLLKRLEQFQQKSRDLQNEGQQLSREWNALMDASIPQTTLRADSPSLSTNLQTEK